MTSSAATVEAYLAELPDDRREALNAVREVFHRHMPKGLEEGMQYGHIGYFVPFSRFPDGYHCDPKQPLPFAGVASQKNHMMVSLFCIYGNEAMIADFEARYRATGKRFDMGKACVRFRKLEDLPLDVLAETLDQITLDDFISAYVAAIPPSAKRKKKE